MLRERDCVGEEENMVKLTMSNVKSVILYNLEYDAHQVKLCVHLEFSSSYVCAWMCVYIYTHMHKIKQQNRYKIVTKLGESIS